MKKILLTSLAALALPVITFAAPTLPAAGNQTTGDGVTPIIIILERIGNWMFGILIAVAAIYILLAAFDFLTAKGDATKVTAARKALTYSLVAVAVAVLTKGLITVAENIARGVI